MRILLCAITLLLPACATHQPSQLQQEIAERKAEYGDQLIQVQTMPPGAIIDWNGDVAGVSPCQVVIKEAYKDQWPFDGYHTHVLRARWPDGYGQEQLFVARTPAPKRVVFLHPIPNKILPQPASLTQR